MARLSTELLSLEIRYKNFFAGDIQYEISFLWENQSMINDLLLKRWSDYWSSRSKGAFLACDFERDWLIETIEKVLETDEADYWEPYEPDVILAIYPDRYFPFLKPHTDRIESIKEIGREGDKSKKEKLPDDMFTVIVFIDAYNFQNSGVYYSSGIALHMIVERRELQSFSLKLREEYSEFKKKFKVDEYEPKYISQETSTKKE